MTTKKGQSLPKSRSNSPKPSFRFLDRSLSNSFDENNGPIPMLKSQSPIMTKHTDLLLPQPSSKTCYNIFKTGASDVPELIEQYSQTNLYYRDESFNQMCDKFIMKIAMDKKIPKEFRAKFPLYQILVGICKIFMLNEYEISAFACTLDHCSWKIDEVVTYEEGLFLNEFPANFGVEINQECKQFIIFLIIMTFSIKQYLNEKIDIDPIQAYCEKLCVNFQVIFNRWVKLPASQKFNYAAPEINKKFKLLSKREHNEQIPAPKDYNLLVDNIMTLTGTYNARNKGEKTSPDTSRQSPKEPTVMTRSSKMMQETSFQSKVEPDTQIFFPESSYTRQIEHEFPRQQTFESMEEVPVRRSTRRTVQRQESFSQLLTNFSSLKRADPYELKDKGIQKKVKYEHDTSGEFEDLEREKLVMKTELQEPRSLFGSRHESENFMNLDFSILSQRPPNASQNSEEGNTAFSRLSSAFSFPYEK